MPEQLSETAGGPRSALSERVRSLRLDQDQRAPRRRTGLPWFLAALFGAATAYLLPREFLRASAPAAVESAVAPVAGIADPAATKPAAGPPGQPSDKVLESKGYLIAKQLILITPKVAGRIEQLFVDEGKVVRKGDTLAILERDEYQFERDASQARLDEANAKLTEWTNGYQEEEVALVAADRSEADSLLKKAEAEFRRMQELRESRNAAPTDYEAAEAAYLAAKARLQRLKGSDAILLRRTPAKVAAIRAGAAQAKADLERTQFRLDNCVVKSPVDGIVLSKKAEEGNVVNPIAFAGSTSICEIADVSKLEVELKVAEADFSKVFDGQRCEVVSVAYPDRKYQGLVRRMPIADRAAGSVPVRVAVEIPVAEVGVYLRPEMSANVSFLRGPAAAAAGKASGAAAR